MNKQDWLMTLYGMLFGAGVAGLAIAAALLGYWLATGQWP